MKTLNALPKIVAVLFFIIAIASCDEDFNTIGADIVIDGDLEAKQWESNNIVSYSRKLDPIQTNIVPIHKLGIYNENVFGKSTANYITQVKLAETDPTFGDSIGRSVTVDSVVLYIPFFNDSTTEDEVTTYTLDSVYGNSPVTISMFESNFLLRDLDPNSNFEETQLYYSNQNDNFEINKGELLVEIEDFVPSEEAIVLNDTVSVSPGIRAVLPIEFFQEKILDKEGDPEINSNNNFKEYFRGLYFKVESPTDDGSLFIFNPDIASITIYYSYEKPEFDDNNHYILDEDENIIYETIEENQFLLNFGGVGLNTYTNELPQNILGELENPDIINGEENLYVRGGEGIITIINLFTGTDDDDNGFSDVLDSLKVAEPLINDASLKFYVDQDKIVGGSSEPERLIIYDLKNNTVLVDYFLDTTSGNEPVNAITTHLGRLERGSDDLGEYYKIRITNHVSNLINKDSTNVQLGLIVSQNVLLSGFQVVDSLTNPDDGQLPRIKEVPRSSLISPEGTVLFGNNTTNEEKRLKLQILYTETN